MKYVLANWKMYLDVAESLFLAEQLSALNFDTNKLGVSIFPNHLALVSVQRILQNSNISIGGQNCNWTPQGAYTGAVSAYLLKKAGCEYALVGHSERRHVFGESDSDVRKKIEACIEVGLTPVICIGETKEEKESGKREYRLKKQLMVSLENLNTSGTKIMVAYEPVWAISGSGTGELCTPADVDDIHGWLRQEIAQYVNSSVPLLYGGSVTADDVLSYVSLGTVDGVLVGKASTHKETFLPIIQKVEEV